ncbi:MAG: CocE/NonD family hydrolase [Candidatus Binatia bacterium]
MYTTDGARCFQAMVSMRDGVRLNTFVFLPEHAGPRYPVILQRTPYGITSPEGQNVTDCTKGWLPDPQTPLRGSLLRGWREIVRHGYAAVYQDTRGRYGSEGEDHVYGDDAADGYDTLEWIASEPWSNHQVGLSGSSAGATTALAAASQGHSSVRAFFAQVGGSSIYDDVVYEGQSIELERLWLWVARNIPGLSPSHRAAVMQQYGLSEEQLAAVAASAQARYAALDAARQATPPFIESPDWMHLPLTGYPDCSVWQPYLDEIISHPAPDAFRARHNFRATITVPGFHVTTWFDIFLTSVLAAFTEIHARVGNQRLWIGPNGHYFVYEHNFWPRDPYFEWFDHWLKGEATKIIEEPAVFYSPRAWVADARNYVANDWRHAEQWPLAGTIQQRWYLTGEGHLSTDAPAGSARSYIYDPLRPIPTLGGRNMLIDSGPQDQRPVQALPNYGLLYRSEVLPTEITIAGAVSVTLHIQSNCPDTDFVAKLIEIHADGSTMLLMDGVVRALYRNVGEGVEAQPLAPDRVYEVTIQLGDIHHTFRAGNRIEVDVTSSNFPRRARNTNSGHPVLANDTTADIRIATNVVHHGAARPSFLVLPLLPDLLREN